MNVKQIFETGEKLFKDRSTLMNTWQEIAEHFYPERADFTVRRTVGLNFADNLTTSYPLLVRRDLGNAFSQMLRPTQKSWFHMVISDDDFADNDAKAWLEYAAKIQRRAMYDRSSQFIRATKEGDHDFAAFGQCALSIELNRRRDGLLYRCWHLRDMAWSENADGKIGSIFRKWKPTVRNLVTLFGAGKVHRETVSQMEREPFCEADCRHMVIESDMVDGSFNTPFVSIYYDVEHDHVIEMIGIHSPIYVIPRWQTVSGSQYGFSPAMIAGLPEARLLQAMMYTLLEAGEKHTNPPMVAVQEAIRSDVSIYAGGITWVDSAYDERLGEVLRPLALDAKGMPLGMEMAQSSRMILAEAFYLNKLTLPQRAPEMTAYEVGQRIQQYIRDALPLFEPMEMDYNGAVCEETFNLLFRNGAFGSPLDLPKSLQGADVQFRFESPLHEAIEREKGNRFLEAHSFVAGALELDPTVAYVVDAKQALREVLEGIGVPVSWTRSEEEVDALTQQVQEQQETATTLAGIQQGAEAAKTLGEANQTFGGIV